MLTSLAKKSSSYWVIRPTVTPLTHCLSIQSIRYLQSRPTVDYSLMTANFQAQTMMSNPCPPPTLSILSDNGQGRLKHQFATEQEIFQI